jgi:hypothetical protein
VNYTLKNQSGILGRVSLYKSSYKLGEDVTGTIDLGGATISCLQVRGRCRGHINPNSLRPNQVNFLFLNSLIDFSLQKQEFKSYSLFTRRKFTFKEFVHLQHSPIFKPQHYTQRHSILVLYCTRHSFHFASNLLGTASDLLVCFCFCSWCSDDRKLS